MNSSLCFTGENAKSCFENFKKCNLKKKKCCEKKEKSGTSSAVVDEAKKDIEPYQFFLD